MTSETTYSAAAQARSGMSRQAKLRLIDELARRANDIPTSEILRLMPSWTRPHVSALRNRRVDDFGWERLLFAAERLGVPVFLSVGEAA